MLLAPWWPKLLRRRPWTTGRAVLGMGRRPKNLPWWWWSSFLLLLVTFFLFQSLSGFILFAERAIELAEETATNDNEGGPVKPGSTIDGEVVIPTDAVEHVIVLPVGPF